MHVNTTHTLQKNLLALTVTFRSSPRRHSPVQFLVLDNLSGNDVGCSSSLHPHSSYPKTSHSGHSGCSKTLRVPRSFSWIPHMPTSFSRPNPHLHFKIQSYELSGKNQHHQLSQSVLFSTQFFNWTVFQKLPWFINLSVYWSELGG